MSLDRPPKDDRLDATASLKLSLERAAGYNLYAAVCGAPAVFGSRDARTIAFWVIWLSLGVGFAVWRPLKRAQIQILSALTALFVPFAFVIHEQLSTRPWAAKIHPIWGQAARLLDADTVGYASIVRDAAWYHLGPLLANSLALILGIIVGGDRRAARRCMEIAAFAGAVYAAYGLFQLFVTPDAILWRDKEAYLSSLTSTFINKNTAATYFGSIASLWWVLLLEATRNLLPAGRLTISDIQRVLLGHLNRGVATKFVLFSLNMGALFLTQSRGGVIATAFALIGSFWLYFRRDLYASGNRIIVAFVAFVAVAAFVQVITGAVNVRLDTQGLVDADRLAVYRATLRIVKDNLWFGTGLGTFTQAFPSYRGNDMTMWGIWNMAHSTPLQLASEMGLPILLLTAGAWIASLVILIRGVEIRRRDRALPLCALSVSVIAVLHSSIDFSLQIPGYAIVVFGLLGLGLAQSFRSEISGQTLLGHNNIRKGSSSAKASV